MRTTHLDETARVRAAQAGDRQALEDVLSARLPFVYTIVRRAMGASSEADDVVQETMLRALRELPHLQQPESFRAWLAAIAMRQISTHRRRRSRRAAETAALEDVLENEQAASVLGLDFEDASVLNLELADQRGQLVRARQWLAADDQSVLSLWWLEVTGQLTRPELASVLGVSVAHATVRVQRMHAQLELTRTLTAALEARPRCAGLETVLRGWDGRPQALWRKRILRHTRSCPDCLGTANGLIRPEGLLVGLALLPVPVALTATLLGKVSAGTSTAGAMSTAAPSGKAGFAAHLFHLGAAHPVSAVLLAGSVMTGAVAVSTTWPGPTPPPPVEITVPTPVSTTTPAPASPSSLSSSPPPSASPRVRRRPSSSSLSPPSATITPTGQPASVTALTPGPASLESVNIGGFFASAADTYGILEAVDDQSAPTIRRRATFDVTRGLADPDCFSFRLSNGQYLRHSSWRVRSESDDGTALFKGDATFCARAGVVTGSIALESFDYPGWFLRHRNMQLWVDQEDGTQQLQADRSFRVTTPLSE